MTDPILITTPSGVFAVASDDERIRSELRAVLRDQLSLADALSVMTAGGFSAIPDFVFALRDGESLRVLTKGSGSAVVIDGTTETVLAAEADVATWSEELVPACDVVTIRLGRRAVIEWILGSSSPAADSPAVEQPVSTSPTDENTIAKPVVSEPESPEPPSDLTVMLSPLQDKNPGDAPDAPATTDDAQATDPPTVTARMCENNHPNPADLVTCRVCGAGPLGPVTTMVRPSVARIVFDDGNTIDLDRPQVIGRRPSLPDIANGEEIPGFVVIHDPDEDLSRSHATLDLDGWTLLITDLNSTNGTTVAHPDQSAVRLRPAERIALQDGSRVSLAESASFVVEAPSA